MPKLSLVKLSLTGLVSLFLFCGQGASALASSEVLLSQGQTVYVPVYSNVYSAPKKIPFQLAAILSIRNTDLKNSITVTSADYFDTNGKLIHKYYEKDLLLGPLAATYIYIPEGEDKGGFGANFIVNWGAEKSVNTPIIECVMIGAKSGQGISFVSPGRVIQQNTK